MKKEDIAPHLDFADHNPDATESDIRKLCSGVLKYKFNSAFVNQSHIKLARKLLKNKAKVGTVISFPLGQDSTNAKISATIDAVKSGADVLDVSMNVGLFKENKKSALKEMKDIVKAARRVKRRIIIKFIIETGYLNPKEIAIASRMVVTSGADFVKTCSGYGPRGASLNDVKTIRKEVGNEVFVKVAGGIRTTRQAMDFIKAGADRIGTSHAIDIVKGTAKKSRKKSRGNE